MSTVWTSLLSGLIPLLVVCFGFGLAFAGVAYLTVRVAERALTRANQSTTFQFGGVKITTGSALVALFIIAAFCGLGIPGYWMYLESHRDDPVFVETHLKPSPASLTVVSNDYGETAISRFSVYRSKTRQHLAISITDFNPVNVVAYYDWSQKKIYVAVGGAPAQPLDVDDGSTATLNDIIELQPRQIPPHKVARNVKTTSSVGVTPVERQAADPPGVVP